MVTSTAWRYDSTSNAPEGAVNFIRFSEARLHAESSRNMYSEHGFEALIRAVFFDVCQRLMVESYCMPGSPHWCVASAICRSISLAEWRLLRSPFTREMVHQSVSSTAACMNSSVTRM